MSDYHDASLTKPLDGTTKSGFLPLAHRKSIIVFCVATLVYWMGGYLYVPVLPVYAQSLGASLSMVGLIVAAYAIPQMLLRIPLGVWFDSLRKRKFLVASGIIMSLLGSLGLGLAPSPWFLFIARMITGAGASAWVIFIIYFTTYYPRNESGRAIGVMNFINWTAILIASVAGGVIAEVWGSRYTFFVAVLFGVIALFVLMFAEEVSVPRTQTKSISKKAFVQTLSHPLLVVVSVMAMLWQFANFASVFGFIPVYATQIGASKSELGIITMLILGASSVAALFVASIAERRGSRFVIVLGSLLMGAGTFAVPFIPNVYILEAVMVINGFGRGMVGTALMALSVRGISQEHRATAMGLYQSVYALGMFLGPAFAGLLADSFSLAAVFYFCSSFTLMIAAMAFLPVLKSK